MDKKQIGIIVQAVAGLVAVASLGLLIKWHPIHISIIVVAAVAGFVGNKIYRQG